MRIEWGSRTLIQVTREERESTFLSLRRSVLKVMGGGGDRDSTFVFILHFGRFLTNSLCVCHEPLDELHEEADEEEDVGEEVVQVPEGQVALEEATLAHRLGILQVPKVVGCVDIRI